MIWPRDRRAQKNCHERTATTLITCGDEVNDVVTCSGADIEFSSLFVCCLTPGRRKVLKFNPSNGRHQPRASCLVGTPNWTPYMKLRKGLTTPFLVTSCSASSLLKSMNHFYLRLLLHERNHCGTRAQSCYNLEEKGNPLNKQGFAATRWRVPVRPIQ